jgi:RNA recognition motif-containing protein
MNTKIYVDNLSLATTEGELMDLFSNYGNVVNVNISVDQSRQKSRGFGFVTMVTPEAARAAIRSLNGKMVGSDTLTVSAAWPREEAAESPSPGRDPRSPDSLV